MASAGDIDVTGKPLYSLSITAIQFDFALGRN
jgi:hypothetical protein